MNYSYMHDIVHPVCNELKASTKQEDSELVRLSLKDRKHSSVRLVVSKYTTQQILMAFYIHSYHHKVGIVPSESSQLNSITYMYITDTAGLVGLLTTPSFRTRIVMVS